MQTNPCVLRMRLKTKSAGGGDGFRNLEVGVAPDRVPCSAVQCRAVFNGMCSDDCVYCCYKGLLHSQLIFFDAPTLDMRDGACRASCGRR